MLVQRYQHNMERLREVVIFQAGSFQGPTITRSTIAQFIPEESNISQKLAKARTELRTFIIPGGIRI